MKILKWIVFGVLGLVGILILVGLWGDMDKIDRLGTSLAVGAGYLAWALGQQIDRVMKSLQVMHSRLDQIELDLRVGLETGRNDRE